MSRIITNNLRHNDASSDNLTLDGTGNITAPGNLSVTGTSTLTNDLVVDTDTLFVDASTDRVGINTSSPSAFLHVQNGEIVKDQDNSQNSANPGFQIKHNGTINGSWRHDGRLEIGGQDANAAVRLDTEGIKFNGDTAAANALDDYEEGSWVPTMSGLSNTPSWSNIMGRYTKIGRLVHLQFLLQPSDTLPQFTSTTAKFQIENVPFAPGNNNAGYWGGVGNVRWQSVDWENSSKNMNGITPDYVTVGITSTPRLEIIFVEANNVWSEARNSLFHNDAFIFEGTVTYHTDL